jgi:quercetin dioxygenase-like cupin family protein
MPKAPYQPQDVELIVNAPDVRVAEITLAPHSDTPPHEHAEVPEVCYCLQGELTCEAEGEATVVLRAGEKRIFAAGAGHQLRNVGDVPCRFLLIHAGGRFDFVKTEKKSGNGPRRGSRVY